MLSESEKNMQEVRPKENSKQLRFVAPSIKRDTFTWIFLITVGVLMFMPFMATFNDLLTRLVISLDTYKVIHRFVVPMEVRLAGVLLWPFGFAPQVMGEYLAIGKNEPLLIEIAWNCVGWQSILFFLLTALIGFQGDKYTLSSKLKALLIGLLGTFWVNIFRITVVSLAAYFLGQNVALIIHDYGSSLAVIAWLFFFWWFTFTHVLESTDSYTLHT